MRSLPLSLVAAALLGGFAGCGGPPAPATPGPAGSAPMSQPTAPATTPAPAASATPAAAGDLPTSWKPGMTKEQQISFMKARVLPPMVKVFQEHDSKKYATTDCKTCHGPQYKEPKEFLPHLTLKDGKITSFAEKPEISKWMAEKVVPDMAAAMGLPAYDPKTHQGFGCGGCHTIDMK